MLVFWIKQEWKYLAVVDIGRIDDRLAYESMDDIDAIIAC